MRTMSKPRQLRDHFFHRAKAEGHAARSVYKLEEIDQRYKLLRAGQRVVDLGAAPGSWLSYAARKVGPRGSCLGIDIKPITLALPPWVTVRLADAFETRLQGPFEVVLSDMAPATMGHHGTDALRSLALAEQAFELGLQHLCVGGHLVVKVLEGAGLPTLCSRIKQHFAGLQRLRPRATRAQSSEIFLIGTGLKPAPANESAQHLVSKDEQSR
ncbi:MAG: RlmE family RNA methyltransferase [Deltaproteobacteria bacterium]|nr:MAG: RlmE family RNA methyltransferase [Deltaproteobacteria bacterium]